MKIDDILAAGAGAPRARRRAARPTCSTSSPSAVSRHHPEIDHGRLVQALEDRERLNSTALGDGVAIPHGKLPGSSASFAAFGRSPQGVDFHSLDGKPTHLFFLLVAPEDSAGAHLKALARISRLLKDEAFRTRLMQARRRRGALRHHPRRGRRVLTVPVRELLETRGRGPARCELVAGARGLDRRDRAAAPAAARARARRLPAAAPSRPRPGARQQRDRLPRHARRRRAARRAVARSSARASPASWSPTARRRRRSCRAGRGGRGRRARHRRCARATSSAPRPPGSRSGSRPRRSSTASSSRCTGSAS